MFRLVWLLVFAANALHGDDRNFVSGTIGVSTLSADGRSILDGARTAVSLYKPENGLTFLLAAGRHLNDYLSVQGSYAWNRNGLALTSVQVEGGSERSYEQAYRGSQHTLAGELLLYFRPLTSFARPYLSAGPGAAHFSAGNGRAIFTRGAAVLPPPSFSSTHLCLRVAVGIDLRLRGGAALRYSFAETIQKNPVSPQLTPVGKRNLANFQNLFGFVWRF